MPAPKKRRRRKRRGGQIGLLALALITVAAVYIAYIAFTQPDRLITGLFKNDTAPTSAEAAEPEDEQESVPAMVDETIPDPVADENAYAMYAYYQSDKLVEYEAYQDEHPELSDSDVVWMVNVGLNKPFYTDAAVLTDTNPLLVNPYNRLPDDFVPKKLVVIDDYGRQATPETADAFQRLREGALKDGFDLVVQSAYRTMDYQRGLYERAGGDGAVARPNYSEHHTGRALDLQGPDGLLDENAPTDKGRWVAAHAHEYGFIVRYTEENSYITGYIPEPWHISFVGSTISTEMHESGFGSLEEYTAKNPDVRLP